MNVSVNTKANDASSVVKTPASCSTDEGQESVSDAVSVTSRRSFLSVRRLSAKQSSRRTKRESSKKSESKSSAEKQPSRTQGNSVVTTQATEASTVSTRSGKSELQSYSVEVEKGDLVEDVSTIASVANSVPVKPKVVDPWSKEEVKKVSNLWNLTAKEEEHLVELGERLTDIDHHMNAPYNVVRFMEARSRSVHAAEKMFRNMIQWRLENNVDTILQDYEPPRLIKDYIPGAILKGYDLDGDPVYTERIGSADTPEMVRRFGPEHMIKHAIWIRETISRGEWLKDYERKNGRPVRQILVVEDLKGLSSAHLDRHLLAVFKAITRLDQDNYPEAAKTIININAPFIFRMVWSIVKHFFDHNVAAKMVFAGPDNTEKTLEKYLDLKVLPKEVVPMGEGGALPGLNQNFKGGPLPPPDASDHIYDNRKETASDSECSNSPSGVLVSTGKSNVDEESHTFISGSSASAKKHFTPVRTFIHEKQKKKEMRKQKDIEDIRDMAARRIQPKERSAAKQERLDMLRDAQTHRNEKDDSSDTGTTLNVSLSGRATNNLHSHDRKMRFFVMSGLISLFFFLLNPEVILSSIGFKHRSTPKWMAILQALCVVLYTLLCGVVHFLVCDISMVYAFISLNVAAKTGAKMKKYYSDNIRACVALVSGGVYVLSFTKAAFQVFLGFIYETLSLWIASSDKRSDVVDSQESTCSHPKEHDLFGSECSSDTAVNATGNHDSKSYGLHLLASWVKNPNAEATSWRWDAFETARIFYSYSAVFLLVFLVLFNLTSHLALRESEPKGMNNDAETVYRSPTTEEASEQNQESVEESESNHDLLPSHSDERSTASEGGASRASTKKRGKLRRIYRRKRRVSRLAVVNEDR